MGEAEKRMIAVCGLDCGSCDIRRVPTDRGAAERVTAWFKEMGWLKEGEGLSDVVRKSPYCKGCRGDRAAHWSADCWILICCVDEKGLESCYQCDNFPCERLSDWGKRNARYAQALDRLKQMRKKSGLSDGS